MPDLTPAEPTVPAGNEDAELQAAFPDAFPSTAAPDPETTIAPDPPPVEPPAADPDFTFATLENGQREMRTATGQVYRGKDDAELLSQLGKAQVAASRRITELSKPVEPVAPVAPAVAASEEIDPTALAILDLIAPALKLKSGAEVVAKFSGQDQTAVQFQEYMAAQAANFEAQKFFMANPDFPKTDEATAKIDTYLQTNNIPFSAQNAEMVYNHLKAKGEMTSAPITTRAAAPVNHMPPPPVGTAPANTGKGAPTDADLWNMTTDQLEQLITGQLTQ